MLTGLRGVGKTVLLSEIERKAKDLGYRTILVEAHEGKPSDDASSPSQIMGQIRPPLYFYFGKMSVKIATWLANTPLTEVLYKCCISPC